MKPSSSTKTFVLATAFVVSASFASSAQQGGSRGMPPEAQEQIHALFENHAKIRREVKLTADGCTALTESDDPNVTAAPKKHVGQMQERLKSGLSVRRWDPAFAEYCDHYDEMDHQFTATDKGVRMAIKGRTANAVIIAQSHFKVISAFAAHGWSEHDKKHDTVAC